MSHIEEAAAWFATLRRGVMTLEERSGYESWIRSRQNRDALAEMEDLWLSLEGMPKPARIPRHLRRAIVSAIFVSSLAITAISVVGDNHFWTALDWTNR